MPGTPSIHKIDLSKEFATPERCWVTETCNTPGDPALSIARARVEPGVTTAWHALEGTVERYIVAAGRGRVEIGDASPAEVGPGDVVLVPPEVRQRITNVGEHDLIFYCVCTPRYEQCNYRSLE